MQEVSGQAISSEIIEQLKALPQPKGILAAVLVGQDPTSESFLRQKEKVAKALGVDFRRYQFPAELKNDELRSEVGKFAKSSVTNGIIVQLPLPEGVNKHYVLNAIPPKKDVDVLSERALGAFYNARNLIAPPAVETVKEIVARQGINLAQSRVAVVGLGALVGKPIALWLMGQSREIFLADKGSDLAMLKDADLIISGVGEAGLIKPSLLKEGAGVIDFGYYYFEDGRLVGDLDTTKGTEKLSFYTPTPGGTGPVLVAKLIENFYKLSQSQDA